MDLGIEGRRAAVAGASGGLGLASAKALAGAGAQVAICGRTEDRVRAAADAVGHGCVPLVCDVATAEGGARFVEMAAAALGGVDILVPNAGGPPPGTFASTDISLYQVGLELNLLSIVGMCKAAIPAMQAQKWGRVIAITSVSVRQPIPTLILSNTARAGVTAFLKTVSGEVARDGVTVNTVQPGIHATDRMTALYGGVPDAGALGIPTGTVGDPDDFGHVVAFLCSEHAKFITGAQLQVDGGSYGGLQ
jgi:3-oxoacyl-[acyl-carrier protein] reductase